MFLLIVLWGTWSAGCVREHSVDLVIREEPGIGSVATYTLEIYAGARCPMVDEVTLGRADLGPPVHRQTFWVDSGARPVGEIGSGRHAFVLLGRDGDCQPVVFGCVTATVAGRTEVRLEVGPSGYGISEPCPSGQTCEVSRCIPSGDVCDAETCTATEGLTCCGDTCTDLLRDPTNCGVCGRVCEGESNCCDGRCAGEDGVCCTPDAGDCCAGFGDPDCDDAGVGCPVECPPSYHCVEGARCVADRPLERTSISVDAAACTLATARHTVSLVGYAVRGTSVELQVLSSRPFDGSTGAEETFDLSRLGSWLECCGVPGVRVALWVVAADDNEDDTATQDEILLSAARGVSREILILSERYLPPGDEEARTLEDSLGALPEGVMPGLALYTWRDGGFSVEPETHIRPTVCHDCAPDRCRDELRMPGEMRPYWP